MRSLATDLLTHPWRAATTLLAPSGLAYLVKLLWPFGFTSLASPLTFLISLPELLVNLLSGKPQQHSIAYHYVAGEAPFVIAAMVLGLRRIGGWLAETPARRPRRRVAAPAPDPGRRGRRGRPGRDLHRRSTLGRASGLGPGAHARAPRGGRRSPGPGAGRRERLRRQRARGAALRARAHRHLPGGGARRVRGAGHRAQVRRGEEPRHWPVCGRTGATTSCSSARVCWCSSGDSAEGTPSTRSRSAPSPCGIP